MDKFVRIIILINMNGMYSLTTSHERKWKNAALLLMASIVMSRKEMESTVADVAGSS